MAENDELIILFYFVFNLFIIIKKSHVRGIYTIQTYSSFFFIK